MFNVINSAKYFGLKIFGGSKNKSISFLTEISIVYNLINWKRQGGVSGRTTMGKSLFHMDRTAKQAASPTSPHASLYRDTRPMSVLLRSSLQDPNITSSFWSLSNSYRYVIWNGSKLMSYSPIWYFVEK